MYIIKRNSFVYAISDAVSQRLVMIAFHVLQLVI